ncbi:MAG: tRNA (adenosine(37)-N6)-threonylcarbamoyltransferase complex transferase subunit TsaD [Candidatus Dormibacteraceae bacterium]
MILGIESSCDESSVALVEGRRVLVNLIHSQVAQHASFGGVVPELAARQHLEKLPGLVELALQEAEVSPGQVKQIAVTRGPGLVGCLLVGVGLAGGLAAAWDVPLRGVNHLWGHVAAAWAESVATVPPGLPLLAMVASGGHSDLVLLSAEGGFELLGRTRDDAAGEAFDKAARMLGLGYPGGPALARLAEAGDGRRQPLPRPRLPGLEYSFSGLKTALRYRLRELALSAGWSSERPGEIPVPSSEWIAESVRADLAAAFQHSVVESLLEKLERALSQHPVETVVVCGGVAANSRLRQRAAEVVGDRAHLIIPPLSLCTDNAAMIALAAGQITGVGAESVGVMADPTLDWRP